MAMRIGMCKGMLIGIDMRLDVCILDLLEARAMPHSAIECMDIDTDMWIDTVKDGCLLRSSRDLTEHLVSLLQRTLFPLSWQIKSPV